LRASVFAQREASAASTHSCCIA